ncbi:MAG TPA: DUF5654 family protein [Candidatus Paceibacterota bacterium]|nr:DUF5654 family protein [Candidatus Paceibacterota bacterium]
MVREKIKKFRKEFKNQIVIAIIAALGFLIALSWRDFISETINQIISSFGVTGKAYLLKLLSAIIVTFIAVLGIMIISKFKSEESKN